MSDTGDKLRAMAAEVIMRAASTVGITGFVEAVMTPAQYAPNGSTLGRDCNRGTAVAIFEALRSHPVRLPEHTVATVPAAASHKGALIYVSNGAAGSPIVAFSNGTDWKRVDTGATISA